jgi:prevent-host-death family protein
METNVSAAEANRKFSELLRSVKGGQSFVVTSHGKAVARITPVTETNRVTARAKAALLARLRSQPVINIGRWTRDELYGD